MINNQKLFLIAIVAQLVTISMWAQDVSKATCDSIIEEGVNLMFEKEHTQSLELLVKAQAMARDNKWHKQSFLAVNNIGANYYSMLDYGEALDNYLKAYTIAIKELDDKYEMIVLNNIAILYSKERDFEKAKSYFTKAYSIAVRNDNTVKKGFYAVNLGLVANKTGDLEQAKAYFDEAIPLLKDMPKTKNQAYVGRAENLVLFKQYNQAKDILLPLLSKLDEENGQKVKTDVLMLLSEIALNQNNSKQAIDYVNTILGESKGIEDRLEAFQLLSTIYAKNGQLLEALDAKDSVLQATADWNKIKNGRLFETNRVKFEIQNYRHKLQENEQILQSERNTFNTILAAAIIIILLIAWALRNSYIKGKQRKIIYARSQEVITLELEKEKSDKLLLEKKLKEEEARALLEEERLKNELESRNRKLSAKALHLLERNELLTSIVSDLENSRGSQQETNLKAYIRKLKSLVKSDEEWKHFIKHFEEVNQGFLSAIKDNHSELNANDIRFISYVYMNLTNKEIAAILSITPEACRKRKERISRKMNLKDSSMLYGYLSGF
ncbi:tetratricopeptide repeat protein [Aequorivita marina]|uniref:tetratricopeptide repeat protein n=1 Tax=Aequorivita marina TaxID=3073654 RepID=UPI002876EF90|nr:tetratricopeptide repeat protein [Aequorivita sp. S2608]MDS1297972.1 tetratricopeptide repeat protein [Aequorivita sp. S2608]